MSSPHYAGHAGTDTPACIEMQGLSGRRGKLLRSEKALYRIRNQRQVPPLSRGASLNVSAVQGLIE